MYLYSLTLVLFLTWSFFQVGETTEAPSSGEFELCWDSGDVSPPYVWSFSEFLDQYNELYEWLIQVQLKLYSHSNPPDKAARMVRVLGGEDF